MKYLITFFTLMPFGAILEPLGLSFQIPALVIQVIAFIFFIKRVV